MSLPRKQGLYNPQQEHDACGVGFIAHIKNQKSHDIVEKGLEILLRLTHRGAAGADPREGDGAGILLQIPDAFFQAVTSSLDITLPKDGEYGVGMVFLPQDKAHRTTCENIIEETIEAEGLTLLGWRDVPVDGVHADLPESVTSCEPFIRQVFIGMGDNINNQDAFERKLYVIRKVARNYIHDLNLNDPAKFYFASMSSRTIVYKGMFLSHQVGAYYEDLKDARMTSALALVHQRFSTNTFPAWELAHPFRMVAHNGEINTVRGNINWMNARRHSMKSGVLGEDLDKIWPVIAENQSDTACFDNALELLLMGGYSLTHAAMLLIPEAWSGNHLMDKKRKAFYEHHAALMEPWDGPAAVAFTDGRQIGATLDRNGLRPARYLVTDDDLVVMASEMGVLDIPEEKIVKKWRLQPGKMFLIDLEKGQIIDDESIKNELANEKDYAKILAETQIQIEDLEANVEVQQPDHATLLNKQQAFGYTQENLKFLMAPMAITGQEATGSMGNDSPHAVLSNRAKPLYNYFRQLFAQVTNPPIDPIREEMVMSLTSLIGPNPNLLGLDDEEQNLRLEVHQPILTNKDLEKLRYIHKVTDNGFRTKTLSMCYSIEAGASGMEAAINRLCREAERAVEQHYNIVILSDRALSEKNIPIPALLATSAVHQHLIRKGLRVETGLVIETGSAREIQHFATLAGFGAEAINPYLAFETLMDMHACGQLADDLPIEEVEPRFIKAIGKGLYKVMSKMGISTYQSYCGAQIFEAFGLSSEFVEKYFTGTVTQIEGAGLKEISEEAVMRHCLAYGNSQAHKNALDAGGEYAWRVRGEEHLLGPDSIAKLQHAVRTNNYDLYKEFANHINHPKDRLVTLRGLFKFNEGKSISIDEVEPATNIVKRFATGAMSFGSISHEAHSTLAIAMNRLGGKSNTGEGGEEVARFTPLENGDSMRSAIKQVASGRFGVTAEYLANADQIQIKMAQGAKPGEGGQLPGHKVDARIGKVRHSTPGVGLISPPPHHDIYSIEDLAQLIFDLKNTNTDADISVKLVSEIGVGTVAAGVVKAHADHVVIAGHDGGTGASPLTSIRHAGSCWEVGLAETQQTLLLNRLRSRTRLQADGQMRTGRDVVIAALLGADEVAFGTIALIAEGCVMMRKCHLNTCPVGVATQDPELRKKFVGKPEDVVNYFMYVAQETREIMAELGFRTFDEMIGRVDMLDTDDAMRHWKSQGIDLTPIFHQVDSDDAKHHNQSQDHGLDALIDNKLIAQAAPALENKTPVVIETPICNVDRSFATMLSGKVAKKYGHQGLPEDCIAIKAKGTAGQALGAWLARGISIDLVGIGNDYVGKGLSGGRISIRPPAETPIKAEENSIVGNTVLFGAVDGEAYFNGIAGERFAVRNSGAVAVVEGVGDHGCEYMTGGTIAILGETGRNFAAGMSGGMAYVFDEKGDFESSCNMAQVALEPVLSEDEALESLDHQGGDLETMGRVNIRHSISQNDEKILHQMITRHVHYTNSARGKAILDNWNASLSKFVKVMPVDYKRALAEREEESKANQALANKESTHG